MDVQTVMQELEALGTDRTKKVYMQNGAHEPLFGVATGAMKPLFRQIRINQALAEGLYATGNYDAMYFAGMIADPKAMTAADYGRWMESAYFYMISDYIVAVTLSEAAIAQDVADRWIAQAAAGRGNVGGQYLEGRPGLDLTGSAGYSCYCWLIGSRKDAEFDPAKLGAMLDTVAQTIQTSPDRTRFAMNNFVASVGVSYRPLHEKALAVARAVGPVEIYRGKTLLSVPGAAEVIETAIEKGRIGFKRRYVRC